jgi:hypothetical protein
MEFSGRRESGDSLSTTTLHWQVDDPTPIETDLMKIMVTIVKLNENNPPTEIYNGFNTSGSAKATIHLSAKFRLTAVKLGCVATGCSVQKEIEVSSK